MTTDLIAQAEAVMHPETIFAWINHSPDYYGGGWDTDPTNRNIRYVRGDKADALIARIRELEGEREAERKAKQELALDVIAAEGVQGKIPRYDLEQPTSHMGSAAMQRDDYGDWVRYEDHAAAITVVSQGDYADLIAQLTRRADEMEAIDHSCSLQPAWVLEAITALEKAVKDNRRAAAALTASEAARKRAERERDGWRAHWQDVLSSGYDMKARAEAAEAKLAEVEKERDHLQVERHKHQRRAVTAEATVATLTAQVEAMRGALGTAATALNRVAWGGDFTCYVDAEWKAVNDALDCARAALTTEKTNG